MTSPSRDKLILAIDKPSRQEAMALLAQVEPAWVKVGLELFCAEGPGFVEELAKKYNVMLDLKLHDIPVTVARAVSAVAGLGAKMLTVHSAGGRDMLRAAAESAGTDIDLLAVTVLTSMEASDAKAVGIDDDLAKVIAVRVRAAVGSNIAGIVCSAADLDFLEPSSRPSLIVTPGVRPNATAADDQKRVATPKVAIEKGASHLVIGRAITNAADPAQAYADILAEMDDAEAGN